MKKLKVVLLAMALAFPMAAAEVKAPTVPESTQIEIFKLQRDINQKVVQYQQLMAQADTARKDAEEMSAQLKKKIDALKVDGYTLDSYALTYKKDEHVDTQK